MVGEGAPRLVYSPLPPSQRAAAPSPPSCRFPLPYLNDDGDASIGHSQVQPQAPAEAKGGYAELGLEEEGVVVWHPTLGDRGERGTPRYSAEE